MWVRLTLTIGFVLAAISGLKAETREEYPGKAKVVKYPRGANMPDPELLKTFEQDQLTRAFRVYVPESISLSDRFPFPRKQKHGSCVSWAVGYAARSYFANLENKSEPNNQSNIISPAWLHTQIRDKKAACVKAGSNIGKALDYLYRRSSAVTIDAVPSERTCAHDIEFGISKPLMSQFKISKPVILDIAVHLNYRVDSTKKDGTKARRSTQDKIKKWLIHGYPVLFSMFVGDTFGALKNQTIYREKLTEQYRTNDVSLHAMVIVGYDERRQAFQVQNSWGQAWGDGGYVWISYDSFRADMIASYVMKTSVTPPRPIPQRPGKRKSWYPGGKPLECADLTASKNTGGTVKVTGFVSSQADLNLVEKKVTENNWTSHVDLRPWPVCEALETLREPLVAPSRPVLKTLTGRKQFKVGETFAFEVRSPNFPSYLYLLYLQADGTVVNLAPKDNIVRTQTPPGTILRFGDGAEGRPVFRASKPAGDETVIAIASRSPLLQLEEFEQGGKPFFRMQLIKSSNEDGPADRRFLSQLRTALLDRPEKMALSREVTASVLHITVKE